MKILACLLTLAATVCLEQSAAATVINFDTVMPASYTTSGSDPIVTGPSQPEKYLVPTGSTGYFFADYNNVNVHATSVATIDLGGTYNSFSVLWGSVDTFNTLDFLSGGDTVFSITGSEAAAQYGITANGEQTITYTTSGFDFDSVRLTSTGHNAFEIDDINVNAVSVLPVVPEPSTWALLSLGAAGTGAMVLRRRAQAA